MRQIVERGHGQPLVLIPGLQGRWEYMRPAVDALAERFRVLTFSLSHDRDDRESSAGEGGDALGTYADQVAAVLDSLGIDSAVICGVSFGGVVALRFAARHPDRTHALVVVSAPGPRWRPRPRHQLYARAPWLLGPLFLAETPGRLRAELAAAIPDRAARLRFVRDQALTLLRAPVSLAGMAHRARLMASTDRYADCARISAPTLVVHGEPQLDRVVQVEGTSEYLGLIHGARAAMIPRTGHLGSITRPRELLAIVGAFVRTVRRAGPIGRDGAPDAAA
jgi:pimeloyl-ACP methyl ester carboxylesterase